MANKLKQIAEEILNTAKVHVSLSDSADVACNDAKSLFDNGKYIECMDRSLTSIKYSVGIFGSSYRKAFSLRESAMLNS